MVDGIDGHLWNESDGHQGSEVGRVGADNDEDDEGADDLVDGAQPRVRVLEAAPQHTGSVPVGMHRGKTWLAHS